jgi:site-specific DNA-methyltransferase (adenine-specific)
MTPTLRYRGDWATIWEGDCRDVAAEIEPGSVSLSIVDGPYFLGLADWDRGKVADAAEWYAPHFDDIDRICAPSASLYVWGTSELWATLNAGIVARGWTFRSLVTWDKGLGFMAGKCDVNGLRKWYDVTEVCGFYQREAWAPSTCAGSEIAYAAGADDRNWIRLWLIDEWEGAGLNRREADTACDVKCNASRHYFPADQWWLPTWDAYQMLAAYADANGTTRERPYLVHPSVWPAGDLRASYDHLRAEYEASRPAFSCPVGVSNVWSHPQVSGRERLKANGATLHPCQKPLLFAERMIRASTRPGETVWAPFGGTLREAVAGERIGRRDPAEGATSSRRS